MAAWRNIVVPSYERNSVLRKRGRDALEELVRVYVCQWSLGLRVSVVWYDVYGGARTKWHMMT